MRTVRRFAPERIVLFGSHADGTPTEDSDVDLLAIMPCGSKPWRVASEVRACVRPTFPLDPLVRSPEKVRERLEMGDPFLRAIIENGKVLYVARYR
jgi:uncharacterized protein